MSVDGALVSTTALFLPGRSLEFTATFSGAPYQHAGFAGHLRRGAVGDVQQRAAATGSTRAPTTAPTSTDTAIPGSWFGAAHRFRIDWSATRVDYTIDGVLVATHNIAVSATHAAGGQRLQRRWQRVENRLDAAHAVRGGVDLPVDRVRCLGGRDVDRGGVDGRDTGRHLAVVLSVRTGNTPAPDGDLDARSRSSPDRSTCPRAISVPVAAVIERGGADAAGERRHHRP